MLSLRKNIWSLFFLLILLIIFDISDVDDQMGSFVVETLDLLIYGISIGLLLLHSYLTLSFKRATIFFLSASSIGLVMEHWGLQAGTIFGGHYVYNSSYTTLLGVPILVILFWAVLTYTGYSLTNSFLTWLNREKPNFKSSSLLTVALLVMLDAWFITAIDLFMDPVQVEMGSWRWLETGPYFGIPTGNFIGWFVVAALITGLMRTIEFFNPIEAKQADESIFMMPVLFYGLIAASFAILAIENNLPNLVPIGLALMLPPVVLNVVLYMRHRK